MARSCDHGEGVRLWPLFSRRILSKKSENEYFTHAGTSIPAPKPDPPNEVTTIFGGLPTLSWSVGEDPALDLGQGFLRPGEGAPNLGEGQGCTGGLVGGGSTPPPKHSAGKFLMRRRKISTQKSAPQKYRKTWWERGADPPPTIRLRGLHTALGNGTVG